jgi:hypothetical protein
MQTECGHHQSAACAAGSHDLIGSFGFYLCRDLDYFTLEYISEGKPSIRTWWVIVEIS